MREMGFVLEVCRDALQMAWPEIMNSDKGSHFTSPKYTQLFLEADTRLSMDHRRRTYDNIFIERLWRSMKYENVYLCDYESPRAAQIGIGAHLSYYTRERLHQSLKRHTPEEIYFGKRRD
jgi:putative transposase